LTSADGTQFDAYFAHPDAGSRKGVVIGPDVLGLGPFYKELAVRFAEAGCHAIAYDYYGRTAGLTGGDHGDDFTFEVAFSQHFGEVAKTPDTTDEDAAAAVRWLRSLPNTDVQSVYFVGFCMGGAVAYREAAAGQGLAGSVAFYGVPPPFAPFLAENRLAEIETPMLVFLGGADWDGSQAKTGGIVEGIRRKGVEVEYHFYEGAPHSFFDRRFAEHQDACQDAWTHVLAFIESH
jgi:carboxymethylenebutenolidase